jgi:hypothetical protein
MRKVENVPTGPNHKPKIPVILYVFTILHKNTITKLSIKN